MQNDLEMLAFAMNYVFEEMNTSLPFESKRQHAIVFAKLLERGI